MLITTTHDLPGSEVTSVLGEVFGQMVRSRRNWTELRADGTAVVIEPLG
jgi:uncharacterized protein YbjQ (UPF0145 family)